MLSSDEVASVVIYTAQFDVGASVFTVVNQKLRNTQRAELLVKYIWLLLQVLRKCESYEGNTSPQ